MTALPTQVNGLYLDHTSLRVTVPGSQLFYSHVKSINYDDTLTPAEAYGTHPIPLPTGLGQMKANGSMTLVKEAWDDWIGHFGDGYGATVFSIVVNYLPRGNIISSQDELIDCRIMSVKNGSTQGQGGLEVEVTLYIRRILRNGVGLAPYDNDQNPPAIAP